MNLAIASTVVFFAATVASAADAARPNILFLFADDQRADTVAALGNPLIKTPHVDRLVRRGVAFDRCYMQGGLQGATCVPSRAMLLSGRSLFRVDEKLLRDVTWPRAFGDAGYATFLTGKWHNGPASVAKSFQAARGVFAGGMTNPMQAKLSDLDGDKLGPALLAPKHACEVFADEAIGFLNQPRDKPFFCYVAFDAPHDPHIVPDDFPITYDPATIPLPPNFLPRHPFDNGEMEIRDEKLLPWPRTKDDIRVMLAEYWRYVSHLDAQVGRILDALDASPHAKNTLVVFAADSGVARGGHGLIGKQNLYEHSIRVPLIVAGPGIPESKRTDALCYLFDVLPTLGARCGVKAPTTSEGIDLSLALSNPSKSVRAKSDATQSDPTQSDPTRSDSTKASRQRLSFAYRNVQRAVRDERWKLIHYPHIDRTQLFDLETDPHETTDLSADPDHAARLTALRDALKAERLTWGDAK